MPAHLPRLLSLLLQFVEHILLPATPGPLHMMLPLPEMLFPSLFSQLTAAHAHCIPPTTHTVHSHSVFFQDTRHTCYYLMTLSFWVQYLQDPCQLSTLQELPLSNPLASPKVLGVCPPHSPHSWLQLLTVPLTRPALSAPFCWGSVAELVCWHSMNGC